MKIYNYADVSLNFPLIFETALNEDVILKKTMRVNSEEFLAIKIDLLLTTSKE